MSARHLTQPRRLTATFLSTLSMLGLLAVTALPACSSDSDGSPKQDNAANDTYTPQPGDVIFQSSPHTPLVDMIEGVSGSHYSHCGIVAQEDGAWVVYEASQTVKATPLDAFINRGRDAGFAVYRFRDAYRDDIPAVLDKVRAYIGRPYDFRYRMDDEHIYCSELIYKAFQQTTGEAMGELAILGEMDWQPYEQQIKQLEGGPVPLERVMITPIDLALAEQLEVVYSEGFEVTEVR